MSIIQGSAMQGASRGFYPKEIEGSLRFNSADTAHLKWKPESNGNRKTWTFSCWMKLADFTPNEYILGAGSDSSNQFFLTITTNAELAMRQELSNTTYTIFSNEQLRDVSAWYHIVAVFDSTQATAADRMVLYINGNKYNHRTGNYVPQNYEGVINSSTYNHYLGALRDDALGGFDGYLAEVFFIDGTAHDADDFGETKNGVWVPKDITASDFTMGTNGFHLTFEDDTEVEAFNTLVWRGTGSELAVTGAGFSPDLVWVKERDNANNHSIYDTVRGRQVRLVSNSTSAESVQTNKVDSFDADGFTTLGANETNRSGGGMVAWCWDAGANNASTGHSSVTWQGSGSDVKVSGLPFSPDLVWAKSSSNGTSHALFDTVRGTGKMLNTNNAVAEISNSQYGYLDSFDKDGFHFQLGTSDGTYGTFSGHEYVAWCWDAGDSDPVSNTQGDVTSTVKASTANGFSVVTYIATGSGDIEVGHGLSQAPDFILGKTRNQAYDWRVYHSAVGATKTLSLNGTSAASTNNAWGQTEPTSTVFTAGRGGDENMNFASGDTIVAYCFHDVAGRQKFGTYDGDHTNGVTVNCGFRPGFVMVKTASGEAGDWEIYDSSRGPFGSSERLEANTTDAEPGSGGDGAHVNFTSTGFELVAGIQRTSTNKTGNTYIYAAFAGSYSDFITDYNTDGTIDSRVKASDTTGFSIVSYTGNGSASQTVGHGLGSAPTNWMVILKNRTTGATDWPTFHSAIPSGRLKLNTTDDDFLNYPITFGTDTITLPSVNDLAWSSSGNDYIAYCWTATANRSAFGSYAGGTNPKTVTTGFRPSLILVKCTSFADQWHLIDSTRDVSNPVTGSMLFANLSAAEADYSAYPVDFIDTGFTIKHTAAHLNQSGATYIYAAFADTREAAFWLDQSSNDNDWQPVNLDHNDTVSDSPTDNFATLNPLSVPSSPSRTFSNGNLRFDAGANNAKATGTILLPTSGQYYWEVTQLGGTTFATVGVSPSTYNNEATGRIGYRNDGQKIDETNSLSSYGATYQSGDTIGVAFDADADTLEFYKNGTSQGVAFTGMAARSDSGLVPWIQAYTSTPLEINFGQQPFKYGPPE